MSRSPSARSYRRLGSLALAAALASGLLAAAPAAASGTASPGGSLVSITSPAEGAVINTPEVPVTIQLQPGAQPPTLHVLLDFQDVTAHFHRTGLTAQGMLTPTDGLVTGNNVLTAKVTGPGGSVTTAQVIFQLNVSGLLGDSPPSTAPQTFSLQTRVITSTGSSLGPSYEVLVGDVSHREPPIDESGPLICGPAGNVNGVWVLVLTRATLDEVSSVNLPLCTNKETAALGTYLAGLSNDDMVIVNRLSNKPDGGVSVKGLGKAMANIGAVQQEFEGIGAAGAGNLVYSVWGIPGLAPGQAYQVGGSFSDENNVQPGSPTAASINTTLVPDTHGNYKPSMRDYVTFDIGPGNGNITVGGHTYPAPPPADSNTLGGFHVLVLDRRPLSVISDRFYTTASALGPAPGGAAMANDLTALAQNFGESALVFIASVGDPLAGAQPPLVGVPTLAQALAPFGGTPDVINQSVNSPYALVGALTPPADYGLPRIDAPEASPIIRAGETGELQGVLQRGTRGMWYTPAAWNAPAITVINGVKQPPTRSNYGLFEAIAAPPTPWPVPVPTGPDHNGELAAYQYLSDVACSGCNHDIRSFYGSDQPDIEVWLKIISDPDKAANPGTYNGQTITDEQFNAVKNGPNPTCQCGLINELTDVLLTDGLRTAMHTLISDSNGMALSTLKATYKEVKATISPPPNDPVGSAVYDIVELLQAVADLTLPETAGVSEPLGLLAALVEGQNDFLTTDGGDLEDQLQTTVANLGAQAADTFNASLKGLDLTFADIVSDWGKLFTVGDGLQNHPDLWSIGNKEADLVSAMNDAMKIGYYRALIPLVYEMIESPDLYSSRPEDFCPHPSGICPFDPSQVANGKPYVQGTSAYAYAVNDPTNGYKPSFDMTLAGKIPVVKTTDLGEGNDPFPAALMKDLTDAGYYPGWFFQRFPVNRVICPPGEFDPGTCYRNSG